MATTEQFENAAQRVQQLSKKPDNQDLLKLYALYKQATEGDVQGDRPGGFDFKGAAKWDAWNALKGTEAQPARQQYVELVQKLEQQG